jgi:hypothetical protein
MAERSRAASMMRTLCAPSSVHAIKGKPALDDERARFRLNFGSGPSELRMIRKQTTRLLDAVKDAIGNRFRTVHGDIEPDVEQIFADGGCENNCGSRLALRRSAPAPCFLLQGGEVNLAGVAAVDAFLPGLASAAQRVGR